MYVKKFISFCQVLKRMHTKENLFPFFLPHGVQCVHAFYIVLAAAFVLYFVYCTVTNLAYKRPMKFTLRLI